LNDGQRGSTGVKILKDGWTVVTQDGSLSAHFEQTVLVTKRTGDFDMAGKDASS